MKKRNKILSLIAVLGITVFGAITTAQTSDDFKNSDFYKKINQLDIPVGNILLGNTLTRYDFTRLLNAIECQDCILPDETITSRYNEESWQLFQQLPGKYFEDIDYLGGTYNGTNYYYCVANIGNNDIMNGYPRGTSICGGKFCGQRNVTKAEFFQTLSNFLIDRNMFNYSAPRGEIKKWYNKLRTSDPGYKYLNTAQIALIKTKEDKTEQITQRLEYTTYLAYCTFNPSSCGFQTFPELSAGNWPIAEANVLIRAGIINVNDVFGLNSAITPADAVEKMWITYDRHIRCEFDSDYDCDGVLNHDDNCPNDYNPTQNDFDGDGFGDVCDDDIDGDGDMNPIGFVDDNGAINYGLLKSYRSADKTPFGEQSEDTAYFIKVNSISQKATANVQFSIAGPEEPTSVEWDFGDLGKGNGKTASHNFNGQGVYTITAKITTKQNRKHILTTQIFIGQTTETSYNLSIDKASINKNTATFQAVSQGNFDYLERENKATGEKKQLKSGTKFTTTLVEGTRNNIVLKGYVNDMIVASASTDVFDINGKFYTFTTVFAPLLKPINTSITTSLNLVNIPLDSISNIARDFGDGTSFMDTKTSNKHTYQSEGKKNVVIRLDLTNGKYLFASSTLNIQDPNIIGNQTYNVIPSFTKKSVKLIFNNKGISIKDGDILNAKINNQQQITLDKPKENNSFLELANKQGVVRVSVKLRHGSLTLENNGVVTFGIKDQTSVNIGNIDTLFSGLKCDLDKDGIPDLYDGDIDGDGIPNLLGLITKERGDCKLVVGENVDKTLYEKHFGICSLDNCPFRPNSDQTDLNVNGIGDACEGNGECGNGIIDLGETCKTCKEDVGTCSAYCGNGKQEEAENCKNCPQDIKVCPSLCGNGKIDAGEECDNGSENNGKDEKCTIACTPFDYLHPTCGNGVYDEGEDCITCPVDLADICIDDGIITCGDDKIDKGENCNNCPNDVGDCTSFCGNGIVEDAENCSNCPKDIGICTSSCGNGIKEPGEQCDNGRLNGNDGKCTTYCEIVDDNHQCGDGKKDEYEQCDKGSNNGKLSSRCTLMCTTYNPLKPNCGNGVIDPGETCLTCPVDLGEKCSARCGNGTKEIGEDCDNGNNNGYDGICSFECKSTTSKCGNNIKEQGEDCDDGAANGTNNSKNNCTKRCTINLSEKAVCGNGIIEGNEKCDLGKNKNGKKKYNCTKDCKERGSCPNHELDEKEKCNNCSTDLKELCISDGEKPGVCGNKIIEPGETCSNCKQDVGECSGFCGNGVVEVSEDCSSCPKDIGICTSSCGNGIKEPGEQCDNGASNGGDSICGDDCKLVKSDNYCGDGKRDKEFEECDLGTKNGTKGSACTTMCTTFNPLKPNCGNGIIDPGETCLTCPIDLGEKCSVKCGDGKVGVGEECDDGPYNGYKGKCSFECTKTNAICGNKKREGNEKCDDGDLNGTPESPNKCSDRCTKIISTSPVCGNGVKEGDEECDLGRYKNNNKKYNCTTNCKERYSCPNKKINEKENCENCPEDLGEICITDGEKPGVCGNGIVEKGENCKNCKDDLKDCTSFCGNGIVEGAEDCSNCSKDVKNCRGSCGNGKKEPGEKCDNGKRNGLNSKCSEDCKLVDSEHRCGDGIWDKEYEECDKGENNGKPSSLCTYMCTTYDPLKPNCGNGYVNLGENCLTCPVDLGEKCSAKCGNGKKEIGEECDNGDNNGYNSKCSFECTKTNAVCGNGNVESGEDCDDGGDNGTSNSKNNCSIRCTTNISPVPVCGNGVKEGDEECDLGRYKNNNKKYNCTANCKERYSCPNGKIDKGETCETCEEDLKEKCIDDGGKPGCGNQFADEKENCKNCDKDVGKCNAYCGNNKIEAAEDCKNCNRDVGKCTGSCGNAIVEAGEECDNGTNINGTDGICGPDCKIVDPNQICGNEKREGSEVCDDGAKNGTVGSTCTFMCTTKNPLKPNCGNGVIDPGETCANCPIDLGAKCLHTCGDGKLNKPWEECDNGRDNNGFDGKCGFDCKKTKATCGNNIVEGREKCDNGTGNGIGTCSDRCTIVTPPVCGNGKKETGEECDYGSRNGKTNSICGTDCKKVKTCTDGIIQKYETCQNCAEDLGEKCIDDGVCGNGILEGKEECDDGRWNERNKNCDKNCKKIDKCGNRKKDEGETCKTCPQDIGPCTAKCGNGIVEDAENCINCPEDVKGCTASCGNGIVEDGEQCDHGDKNGKDKLCSKTCEIIVDKTKPYCGDGVKNTEREKCDNGAENGKSGCSYICTEIFWPTSCGNGIIDVGETCMNCPLDLGKKCQTKCGNGKIDTPWEECDNGTRNGRDGKCTTQCKNKVVTICGNNQLEEGEECDHGSSNGEDKECTKKCTKYNPDHPNCGNGIVDSDENCTNCPIDVGLCWGSCGNGKLELSEECDHGSENNGKDDLCDENCRNIDPNKLCGNGYTNENEGEECDDGEQNGKNEQCSLNCKKVTRPNCGNGKIENDENCNNCPEDLGVKCITHCGNNEIEQGEQCDNGDKNGIDNICSTHCTDVNSCGNGEEDDDEDCISCSTDLGDKCVDHGEDCPNGKIESNEHCMNCSNDTGKCPGSCGNRIKEPGEQCDDGDDNGTENSTCSKDCRNTDPIHYCGNREVEKDLGEICDEGDDNGNFDKGCRIDCQKFDPDNPLCGNGIEDEGETCDDCAIDLPDKCNKAKCGDGIVTEPYEECDPKADNPEGIKCVECKIEKPECINGDCDTICNRALDKDCDGCYDDNDPCPEIAGDPEGPYKCCPVIPDNPPDKLCPGGNCPLVNPICNQCPCQYADYNNTLQKNDQVRARLRDQGFMVHYNYSPMVNISNYIN